MQNERDHTKRNPHIKRIAMLLAAAFLVTAVAISPARAKHDQDDEHGGHRNDRHHEQKGHNKHWHEYPQHVYYPPPVVYAPDPYYPPPPPFITIVVPFPH